LANASMNNNGNDIMEWYIITSVDDKPCSAPDFCT
jgi:hypothetical protein